MGIMDVRLNCGHTLQVCTADKCLVNETRRVNREVDLNNARFFDDAANRVSGLRLEECGEDGHAIANKLWKVSEFLKQRVHGLS